MPSYFVRSGGHIHGPHPVPAVLQMARDGALSPSDEVSTDRLHWTAAHRVPELFAPEPSIDPGQFYYALSGESYGPVSPGELAALVSAGTIGPDDLVWKPGESVSHRAKTVPELSAAFQAMPIASPVLGYATAFTERDVTLARRHMQRLSSGCAAFGFITGVLLILLFNLPFATPMRPYWWWEDFTYLPLALQILLIHVFLSGLALSVMSLATRGMARGITFTAIPLIAIALPFLQRDALRGPIVPKLGGLIYFLPLLAAALMGTADFRLRAPQSRSGRIWHGVIGSLLATITIGYIAVVLISLTENSDVFDARASGIPASVIVSIIIIALGTLSSLVAGVAAIAGFAPHVQRGFRMSQVFAAIAFLAPGVAIMTFSISQSGNAGADIFTGQILFIIFRVLGIVYCMLFALTLGLAEILATLHLKPLTQSRASTPPVRV